MANERNVEVLKQCLANSPTQALDPDIIDEVARQLASMGCLGPATQALTDEQIAELNLNGEPIAETLEAIAKGPPPTSPGAE